MVLLLGITSFFLHLESLDTIHLFGINFSRFLSTTRRSCDDTWSSYPPLCIVNYFQIFFEKLYYHGFVTSGAPVAHDMSSYGCLYIFTWVWYCQKIVLSQIHFTCRNFFFKMSEPIHWNLSHQLLHPVKIRQIAPFKKTLNPLFVTCINWARCDDDDQGSRISGGWRGMEQMEKIRMDMIVADELWCLHIVAAPQQTNMSMLSSRTSKMPKNRVKPSSKF
jgi:hypothetical protein